MRSIIVPWRRHSLRECDEIIVAACQIIRSALPAITENACLHDMWIKTCLHETWINACMTEATKPLTRWEEKFLTSVSDQLTMSGSLSKKQAEVLERIYTEKV